MFDSAGAVRFINCNRYSGSGAVAVSIEVLEHVVARNPELNPHIVQTARKNPIIELDQSVYQHRSSWRSLHFADVFRLRAGK